MDGRCTARGVHAASAENRRCVEKIRTLCSPERDNPALLSGATWHPPNNGLNFRNSKRLITPSPPSEVGGVGQGEEVFSSKFPLPDPLPASLRGEGIEKGAGVKLRPNFIVSDHTKTSNLEFLPPFISPHSDAAQIRSASRASSIA
jgi:hypothetical protein